jgi:hypothetical protein
VDEITQLALQMARKGRRLYKLKNPTIRKIALVAEPASGFRWHLLKQAPGAGGEPDGSELSDAELSEAIDGLSESQAEELLERLELRERIAKSGDPDNADAIADMVMRLRHGDPWGAR